MFPEDGLLISAAMLDLWHCSVELDDCFHLKHHCMSTKDSNIHEMICSVALLHTIIDY